MDICRAKRRADQEGKIGKEDSQLDCVGLLARNVPWSPGRRNLRAVWAFPDGLRARRPLDEHCLTSIPDELLGLPVPHVSTWEVTLTVLRELACEPNELIHVEFSS